MDRAGARFPLAHDYRDFFYSAAVHHGRDNGFWFRIVGRVLFRIKANELLVDSPETTGHVVNAYSSAQLDQPA